MSNFFKIKKNYISQNYPIYFIADIAANHDGDINRAIKLIKLAKDSGADAVKFQNYNVKKYVIYETDLRLLKFLLIGSKYAHWNNAEIGSHIKFYRKPDVFERELYYSMSYFHN